MEENTFYTNQNYVELKNRLDREDALLLARIVGDAIQYGIEALAKKLNLNDKPV